MEYIATFDFKTYTDTPQLARLKSGFLLKEIIEHFYQKVNSTLQPNRSVWMYSAHDITITNMLNSLNLYEVNNGVCMFYVCLKFYATINNFVGLFFSYTFHRTHRVFTLNFLKMTKMSITFNFSIESLKKKKFFRQFSFQTAVKSVR